MLNPDELAGPQADRPTVLEVDERSVTRRLDNYLRRILKGVPKSHIYRIIRDGQVRVNGGRVKPDYRLQPKDKVRIPPVRTASRESVAVLDLSKVEMIQTLYEDQSLLVVNKPPGIAVHGGTGLAGGIIDLLRAERYANSFLELAHRLDKDTSGCLILSKTPDCLRSLHASLRRQKESVYFQKTYHIIVVGKWEGGVHEVKVPIKKTRGNVVNRVIVSPSGSPAQTFFQPLRIINGYTLVEVKLMTGRMHQIRVHAASVGFPVAADRKYGNFSHNQKLARIGIKRQLLHATKIALQHPDTDALLEIEAPFPDDFVQLMPVRSKL